MDAFEVSPLCPAPVELALDHVAFTAPWLVITAHARRRAVTCPLCGRAATRVHSRYRRSVADLPWQGLRVRLIVEARRFFCDTTDCARRIFTERFPTTVAPYGRRTRRAAAVLEAVGFAVGGRPGARLAAALGLDAAAATRIVAALRATSEPVSVGPRVLGVDDWAMRRGQRYGTILVDLERRRVIDLLPDREAATFAAWLGAHPGVEIVCRDRGQSYAEGGRAGAPSAVHVADRFHLLHNLVDALEQACGRHHRALRAAARGGAAEEQPATAEPSADLSPPRRRRYSGLPRNRAGPTAAQRRSAARRARRLAQYEQVVVLRAAGESKLAIARLTGLNRRTVDTWLAAGSFPERALAQARPTCVDPFTEVLAVRIAAGEVNAAQLTRELVARGYGGSYQAVRRAVTRLRVRQKTSPSGACDSADTASPTAVHPPSPRQVAWLLRRADDTPAALTAAEHAYVTRLCEQCPALGTARALAAQFAAMCRTRDANALAPWLESARGTELRAFVTGIERDRDAVLAALCFRWSTSQVEGQVQRLKVMKRSMYGRANFDLLRKRVLHAA
jgi:transposase